MLLLSKKIKHCFQSKGNLFFYKNWIMKIKQYDLLENAGAYKALSFCVRPIKSILSFMVNQPHHENVCEFTS